MNRALTQARAYRQGSLLPIFAHFLGLLTNSNQRAKSHSKTEFRENRRELAIPFVAWPLLADLPRIDGLECPFYAEYLEKMLQEISRASDQAETGSRPSVAVVVRMAGG